MVVAVLLAGGGDGPEEVVLSAVPACRSHGVGLDGLDQAAEGIVVEGPLDIGGGDARPGEDGDLLVGLEALDAVGVDVGGGDEDGQRSLRDWEEISCKPLYPLVKVSFSDRRPSSSEVQQRPG